MKISNFKASGPWAEDQTHRFATIDVTTGFLWWKKTVERQVYKEKYSVFWKFVSNGVLTPGFAVEALSDAYEAQEALKKAAS